MGEIVGIARGAVVRVLAGEVGSVFAHVERAKEDRVGRLQAARPGWRREARERARG